MYPMRDKYQSDRSSNICHLGDLKPEKVVIHVKETS